MLLLVKRLITLWLLVAVTVAALVEQAEQVAALAAVVCNILPEHL
jgi:hypothetical protein